MPYSLNTNNSLLYSVTARQAARYFLLTHVLASDMLGHLQDKIIKLWNRDSAAIVSCKICAFVFADPFVSGDNEFYNLLPHATAEGPENWKWEFDKTCNKTASIANANNNLSLLEIGASTGTFVKRITKFIK
jgi:hypothetical protein